MILNLLNKPGRYRPLVEVDRLMVSTKGIYGAVPSLPIRQVLIVPQSTLDQFRLSPGDLRENVVVDDTKMDPLHSLPSGTILKIGEVLVRLTVHCEPCGRLKGVVDLKEIEHKRGYLGAFLNCGQLNVGDSVVAMGVQYEAIPYDLKERLSWFLDGLSVPVEVTTLVHEIGLSLSYCRAIPNLLRGRPDLVRKVTFRGRVLEKARPERGRADTAETRKSQTSHVLAQSLEFIPGAFVVYLHGDQSFTVPIATVPALAKATIAERNCWEFADQGSRIQWPGLGIDVAVCGLLGLPD